MGNGTMAIGGGVGVSALALVASLIAASPALAQSGENTSGVADIIVTAQKREESLQDIPVAVTALDFEAISDAQVSSFNDLDGLAPSLTVATGSSGSIPIITLRGILGYNIANGVDSPIATYLNGVYLPRLMGVSFDTADLERVEVLRGPQGTLYGKNSTGGAINLILSKPKGELGARQEITVGDDGRLRSKTRIDLPSAGGFSIMGTFVHDEINGFTRNAQPGITRDYSDVTRGFIGERTSPKSFGGKNSEAGVVSVNFAPDSSSIEADYTFIYADAKNSLPAAQAFGFQASVQPLLAAQPLVGGTVALSTSRLRALPGQFNTYETNTNWAHIFSLSLDLTDNIQFKSITGYNGFDHVNISDLTGNGDLRGLTPETFGQPFSLLLSVLSEEGKNFSQEMQLTYEDSRLSLIGGVYYSKEKTTSVTPTYIFQALPAGSVTQPGQNYNDLSARNSSYAAFGMGTMRFSDRLEFSAGLRYTHDKRRTISRSVVSGVVIPDFAKSFDNVSWTTNLTFKPTADHMIYAKVGTGYLSGGVFNGASFNPEKVTQYEVGTKLDLLDRRLRINAAAYYSDYKNKQIGQQNAQFIFVYQNAGKAEIKGAELEVTAVPVDGLVLSGSYGYSDFKYKEYFIGGVDLAGSILVTRIPKHTLALGAKYTLPAFNNGMEPSIGLNGRWHSKIDLLPFLGVYPDATYAATRNNDSWDVDARASLAKIPFGPLSGKVSVWTQNLLDKQVVNDGGELGFAAYGSYTRGRTFGVDVIVEF